MAGTLVRYILEIRYLMSPSMMDRMGYLAEVLNDEELRATNITTATQINFASKNNKYSALLSTGNFAFFADYTLEEYKNSIDDFYGRLEQFVLKVWPHIPNGNITRIGVRSILYTESETFKKTFDAYKEKYFNLKTETLKAFDGDLVDVGVSMNFKKLDYKFHVTSGPMEKKQAVKIMKAEKIPENGIFVDVDYYIDEKVNFKKAKQLLTRTHGFLQMAKKLNIDLNEALGNGLN